MIYDVLGEYKKYLAQSLSKATVQTYGNRLEWLLKDQSILDIENGFDIQPVLQSLQRIKYKNEFSQYKNALLYFLQFKNIPLSEEQSMLIKSYEENTKKKYRKQTVIDYESIKNKITHIRNKKLKLGYQTMLSTGLRVFELSQVKKNDCIINSDNLRISFIGKGGKKETVKISNFSVCKWRRQLCSQRGRQDLRDHQGCRTHGSGWLADHHQRSAQDLFP